MLFQKSRDRDCKMDVIEIFGCLIKLFQCWGWGVEARLVCTEECAVVFTASLARHLARGGGVV